MKYKLTLLFLCLILTTTAWSQSTLEIDDRLRDVYDTETLEKISSENPFLIQRWNYYLDHSYFIRDIGDKEYPPTQTIVIEDLENFNVLALERTYKLARNFDKQSYYFIENTDKVLIFYAETHFSRMLNEHLGRTFPTK